MIDINKKYRTRHGREVSHLHRAPEGWPFTHPWRGIIEGQLHQWTDTGAYHYNNEGSPFDLIEVREPREFRLVVSTAANDTCKPGTISEFRTNKGPECLDAPFWEEIRVREVIEP